MHTHFPNLISLGASAAVVLVAYLARDCSTHDSLRAIGNLLFIAPVPVFPVQSITAALAPSMGTGRISYILACALLGRRRRIDIIP